MKVIICLGRDFLKPENIKQNESRAKKAAELYLQNVAQKIILSGGFYSRKDLSEAEFLARICRKEGVPQKDLILEEKSKETIENAQYCLEIMNKKKFDSAVIITSNFHLRRTKYIFNQIMNKRKDTKIKLEFIGTANHFNFLKTIYYWWKESWVLIKLRIINFPPKNI
tara:strand:- start:173 stop:676 length:504 start_codon:yes stop_codon:yes gene_type:complete